MAKRKILVVGDYNVPTGYGYVNESIFDRIYENFDISVLACNYDGFKPVFPARFPVWACRSTYNLADFVPMIKNIKPDIIYTLNDGYVMPMYVEKLPEIFQAEKRPVWVQHVVFDGAPLGPWADSLNHADCLVFPTPWQQREVAKIYPHLKSNVIWHGVDKLYFPMKPEDKAKVKVGYYQDPNVFVFGMVGKNFQRKRFPELVESFAKFKKMLPEEEGKKVVLAVYTTEAHLTPDSFDILTMATHFGLNKTNRDVVFIRPTNRAFTHAEMNQLYNSFDVNCLFSYGEGYGLPINHACAVGIPSLVTDNSVMRDLQADMKCIHLVPPINQRTYWNNDLAHIRYLPDTNKGAEKMLELYSKLKPGAPPEFRDTQKMFALDFAKRRDWDIVAREWAELFQSIPIEFPNRGEI
jgi:glycosyltransferase involved in cell wall biosynthesis